MRIFSLLLIVLSCGSVSAIDVSSIVQKIQSCEGRIGAPTLLVVGLGNNGYGGTRHNAGEDFLTRLESSLQAESMAAPEHWLSFQAKDEAEAIEYVDFSGASSPRRSGLTVEYRVGGRVALAPDLPNVIFVHPDYDINESGHFVAALAKSLNASPQQILVILDDLTLARNQFVLSMGKPDGSGDGHNGLKSINALTGSGSYYRLRIGVSNPKTEKLDISRTDWVLGQMPEEDRAVLFADDKFIEIQKLIRNLQARVAVVDEKERQKSLAESNVILKRLNGK